MAIISQPLDPRQRWRLPRVFAPENIIGWAEAMLREIELQSQNWAERLSNAYTDLSTLDTAVTDLEADVDAALVNVSCRASRSTNQSITANTYTAITMTAEVFDNGGMFSTGTNPTRITVPTGMGGVYIISGQVNWQDAATGERSARLRLNGSTDIGENRITNAEAISPGEKQPVTTIYTLAAGDYIELMAEQILSAAPSTSINVVSAHIAAARMPYV